MISSKTYNYTVFGIHSNAERYSWAACHLFVLLSSLVGDTLIIHASCYKEAFKLNKFIVTVIQYIAASDIVYAIIGVLPRTVSLITNSWVLGDALCYARIYLGYFFYVAGMWLIAVLTLSKFLHLKYPAICGNWSPNMAHIICSLTLIPSVTMPILFLIVDKDDIDFDYRTYTCDYGFEATTWEKLFSVIAIIIVVIPNFVIVATTVPTLKYLADARKSARRVQGSVPWQGAATVALTSIVYCVSTLPTFVYFIGISSYIHLARIAKFLLMINIMSNFYIYTLTIKSFRRFILSKIPSAAVQPTSSKTSRNKMSTGKQHLQVHIIFFLNL